MSVIDKALAKLRAINPEVANKAEEQLKNYSLDEKGLIQLVNEYGGSTFIDKAVDFTKNKPKVKMALRLAGINVDKLAKSIKGSLDTPVEKQEQAKKPNKYAFNAKDRLAKLK